MINAAPVNSTVISGALILCFAIMAMPTRAESPTENPYTPPLPRRRYRYLICRNPYQYRRLRHPHRQSGWQTCRVRLGQLRWTTAG